MKRERSYVGHHLFVTILVALIVAPLAVLVIAGCAATSIPKCPLSQASKSTPSPFSESHSAPMSDSSSLRAGVPFIQGVDASFLQEIEEHGGTYYENGIPKDALRIFKNHGVNYVRLRIWHTPTSGYNDLAHTLTMARRVKSLDLGLLIDVHYSDTWADPGHQTKPAAWAGLTFYGLEEAMHDYTSEVITALKHQNTLPDIVQIGNEITSGILWDDGRVGGTYDANWPRFAALLKAAINGVKDALRSDQHGPHTSEYSQRGAGALPTDDRVAIMLHVDAGGNNATCRWFLDNVIDQKVSFELIGLSYYPWWHGSLRDLENNVNDLAKRYGKQIVVVETAYPWTLEWHDSTANLVGEKNQLLRDFAATVEGQRDFLTKEKGIIKNIPCSRGVGMFYWAPEYISVPGVESVWENVTLFDFQGRALSSLDAFADSGASPSLPVRVKQK
jgi:arabinogalactan endo-1,4-beta-galactosidase